MPRSNTIEVENVNVPGKFNNVNAEKYVAMRDVLLKVLPKEPPGLTQTEMSTVVLPFLPQELWPDGEKSMWWVKTVQLDLEAKGLVSRYKNGKLIRWHLANNEGATLCV